MRPLFGTPNMIHPKAGAIVVEIGQAMSYFKHKKNPRECESPEDYSAGGDDRIRTGDLRLARAALSQLSYIPNPFLPAGEPAAGHRVTPPI